MTTSKKPTHMITHVNGRSVAAALWDSVVQNLNSPDPELQMRARQSVCMTYKNMSNKQYSPPLRGYVGWHHLTVTRIAP